MYIFIKLIIIYLTKQFSQINLFMSTFFHGVLVTLKFLDFNVVCHQ